MVKKEEPKPLDYRPGLNCRLERVHPGDPTASNPKRLKMNEQTQLFWVELDNRREVGCKKINC